MVKDARVTKEEHKFSVLISLPMIATMIFIVLYEYNYGASRASMIFFISVFVLWLMRAMPALVNTVDD